MEKKKKVKGFTLIELLAVITIVGILVAIAIPTVNRIIYSVRKRAFLDTIDNYIKQFEIENQSSNFDLTDENTIYAIPAECIYLESGGENPFGEWLQANDSYWSYVLVKRDEETYNFIYGFTFKDSDGNILEPTPRDTLKTGKIRKIKSETFDMPKTGLAKDFYSGDWEKFKVNDNTKLKVLYAAVDGKEGDGKRTCTLNQRGKNHETVESEKKSNLTIAATLGDYVKMTPALESFTIDKSISNKANGTVIYPQNLDKWRVIEIKENGEIELVSASIGTEAIYLRGMKDYANLTGILNLLASKYENNKYTVSSRSFGYDGQIEYLSNIDTLLQFNDPFTSTSKYICKEDTNENSNEAIGCGDMKYLKDVDKVKNALGTLHADSGYYPYYTASRRVRYSPTSVNRLGWYAVEIGYNDEVTSAGMINGNCTNSCAVAPAEVGYLRPIITMKSNLKVISGDGTKDSPYILE